MTVVIRMKRSGRRNRPCYRISVADSKAPRDGATIETLGLYDPIAPRLEAQLRLDVERARHWLRQGARPSETVASIFRRQGVYQELPAPKKRERPGRKRATKTKERRQAAKQARSEAKAGRRASAAAAKKAAQAEVPAEA